MALEQIGLAAILDDRNFQAGMKRYTSGLGQMTSVTDGAAKMLSGAFVVGIGAVTAASAAILAAAKVGLDATLAWAENMDKLGDQFGMSGEQASAWTFLMNKVGLSLDEGAQGLNFFTKNLSDLKNAQVGAQSTTAKSADEIANLREQLDDANTRLQRAQHAFSDAKKPTDSMRYAVEDAQKAVNRLNADLGNATKIVPAASAKLSPFGDALKKLGISAYDSQGKMKDFDTIMPEIMDKFSKLPVGINASALAMDLFGARGGSKFLDFLRQGGAGLTDATQKVKEFGLEMSTDEVNAAEEFGFQMNELNLQLTGVKNTIGRYVLPLAQELVRWISVNAIPVITDLAKRWMPILIASFRDLSDWISTTVLPILFQFTNWISTTAVPAFQLVSGLIGDIISEGGDLGVFADDIRELSGIDLGGLVDAMRALGDAWGRVSEAFAQGGILGAASQIATEIQNAWPTISAALQTWSARFWDWVTAPSGVVATTAGNLVNVVYAIADWLGNPANTQPIWNTMGSWVWSFWNWVTDPDKGLLVTVANEMGKIATAIENWANDPQTQKRFAQVGTELARYILDGMGKIFSDQKEGDSQMNKLWRTLLEADRHIAGAMMGLGKDIANFIFSGLASFFTDPITAENFALDVTSMITNAMNYVISQIPFILAPFAAAWQAAIGLITGGTPQAPEPPGYPPGGIILPPFQHGGYVPRTMPALLHAGEYVIPARQVSNITHNTRVIGEGAVVINFPSTGGLTQQSIRDTVFVAVRQVLDSA